MNIERKRKEAILEVLKKLEDLDYFIFAGFAIYLYTRGKRKFSDIDLLIRYRDLKKLAKRIGGDVEKRKISKGDFTTEDYFLNVDYKGQEIEAISPLPEDKDQVGSFDKQFKERVKKKFLGQDVYLAPKEGVIVHKAVVNREKDRKDLEILRGDLDIKLLKEIASSRGEKDKVLNALSKIGYKIN